jgi:hypothetical protein
LVTQLILKIRSEEKNYPVVSQTVQVTRKNVKETGTFQFELVSIWLSLLSLNFGTVIREVLLKTVQMLPHSPSSARLLALVCHMV